MRSIPTNSPPENLVEHFQPALIAVADLPRATLTDAELIEIRHGRSIAMPRTETSGTEWAAVDSADQLVAILHEKHEGRAVASPQLQCDEPVETPSPADVQNQSRS